MAAVFAKVAALLMVVAGLWFAAALVIAVGRAETKKRELAAKLACASCKVLLGEEAVVLGQEQWLKHMEMLRMLNPNPMRKLRVPRTVHAQCTHCGARYRFDDIRNEYVKVDVMLSFERPKGDGAGN